MSKGEKEISTFVGIDFENDTSISIEFDIPFELFFITLLLSKFKCKDEVNKDMLKKELKRKKKMINELLENLD